MFQHPKADGEEDERRDWITPGPIRSWEVRAFPAQNKDAKDGQGRTEGEAELDVAYRLFESSGQQEHEHDRELGEDRVDRNGVRIAATEPAQGAQIFSHGRRD